MEEGFNPQFTRWQNLILAYALLTLSLLIISGCAPTSTVLTTPEETYEVQKEKNQVEGKPLSYQKESERKTQASEVEEEQYVGINLAITPFDNNSPVGGGDVDFLSDWLLVRLTQLLGEQPTIRIVERDKLESLLAELELGTSSLADENNALRLGKIFHADYFLLGNYFVIHDQIYCTARLVDVSTGKVIKAEESLASRDNVTLLIEDITAAIYQGMGVKVQKNKKEYGGESIEVAHLYVQAEQLAQKGKKDTAIEGFLKVLEIDPANVWAKKRIQELLAN